MKQLIKRMTRVLPAIVLALLVGVSVPIAYAGTTDGGGTDSSGMSSTTAVLNWTGGAYSSYATRTVAGWNLTGWGFTYVSNSDFSVYTRAYACTDFSRLGSSYASYGYTTSGKYSTTSTTTQRDGSSQGRSWGTRGNWITQGKSYLQSVSSDLLDSSLINDDTITETSAGILWSNKYNNYLAGVWVDYDKDFQTYTEYEYEEKIVYCHPISLFRSS